MTENTKQKEISEATSERNFALKLLLTVILAFASALLFRRSMGIWAMTPLSFIISACGAFIGIRPLLKNVIFGITVFAVNTIEQQDMSVTLTFVALCLLVRIVSDYAVGVYKNSKKRCIAIASAGALVCMALSCAFIGNPIMAIKADVLLDEYVQQKYPANEKAYLGNFEFTNVYYNFHTKAYSIDAVSDKFPTEEAPITLSEDNVRDGFKPIMEEKIC